MKKIGLLLIAVLIIALTLSCGSGPKTDPNFPAWFNEMPPEDAIWGIGFAKLQNDNLAMQTATTRAQNDAARQISAMAQSMLTDYASESGLASNPRSVVAIENISRNIVNMNLSGAQVNKRDKMPDGTWFVRIAIRKADATRQANSIINNELADYAEFRADRALQMLDYQINNTPSRPTGIGD